MQAKIKNEIFVTQKQSFASRLVHLLFKVILYPQRKMTPDQASKYILKGKIKSDKYVIPSFFSHLYGISTYEILGHKVGLIDKQVDKSTPIVLYLHGGGYVDNPLPFHYIFLNKLSKKLQTAIHFPLYPKIPRFSHIETLEMVTECYKSLLTQNKAEQIVIMGDSAGASIALALAQQLVKQNLPQPKHIISLSPCFDTSLSIEDNPNHKKDPMFYTEMLKQAFLAYAGSEDNLRNPDVSPEFGSLGQLAPITLFAGTKETLYPYAQRFLSVADKFNQEAVCYSFHNLLHVFPLMPIPEAKIVLNMIKKIILS